ncbi:MAG: histidine kinase [Myxococcota bacterium]
MVNRLQEAPRARTLAWAVGVVSVALIVGALIIMYLDRGVPLPEDITEGDVSLALDILVNVFVPIIGVVLATRRPSSPIGWMFLLAGFFLGLGSFTQQYAIRGLIVEPGSLPLIYGVAWLANWSWAIPIGVLPFLFLLFPDGHLPSERWRWVAWFDGIVVAALTVGGMVLAAFVWSTPFATDPNEVSGPVGSFANVTFGVSLLLILLSLPVSFVGLVMRFRRSRGEERLQLKWFVTAAAFVAASFVVTNSFLTGAQLLSTFSLLFLYASIAIAVLKYRLYDINVVIGRAVVFTVLAAFITIVYIGLVIGVGTLVGNDRSPLLSAVAAAVVAVAFQPVRERARRLANRVVYGKRATPYEVLAGFAERASETYSTDDVLPRLVRVLAEGIGAERATVWLAVGSELRSASSWPDGATASPVLRRSGSDQDLPVFPERERAFPVRHGGELLGAISVVTPVTEPLGPDRERLVSDVAAQTGLVLRNVRLIEDLRESRRRIVATQDVRAKALERNIHDGAQQQLVALAVKQRLAETLVDRDPTKAKSMLADIQAETHDALENLRDLARGIYPPLLADQGLASALQAQARKSVVPVDVHADGIGRCSQEVESAVYFSCLEAMQNVTKYAHASQVTIDLEETGGSLRFSVVDDGVGFDVDATSYGTGLQGMADRLDAINGSLEVRSAPGGGTTVEGTVPLGA